MVFKAACHAPEFSRACARKTVAGIEATLWVFAVAGSSEGSTERNFKECILQPTRAVGEPPVFVQLFQPDWCRSRRKGCACQGQPFCAAQRRSSMPVLVPQEFDDWMHHRRADLQEAPRIQAGNKDLGDDFFVCGVDSRTCQILPPDRALQSKVLPQFRL